MDDRGALVRAITAARTGPEQAAAVAALDRHDRQLRAVHEESRGLSFAASAVRQALTPVPVHEHHTSATDWLGDFEASAGPRQDYRTAMIAEASSWYRSVPREVRADPEEFAEQARLRAYTAASAYGEAALPARREFLTCVGYLAKGAASGLPQIDQVIDANNQPAPTPYPTEVFDNFAPEENDYNVQVESPDHQSQVSSEMAPMLQQIEQQDSSGSGFGSGPELPSQHDTQMDTQYGYAEVPLGPPGQIRAAPGAMPQGQSAPNPVAGTDMDEGDENRPTTRSAALTPPDWAGYRWRTTASAAPFGAPLHQACGSLHWPGERCGTPGHTASVSYEASMDSFRSRQACETAGFREGLRVSAASGAQVAVHHNEITGAFATEARTEPEIHWLHGYLAAIRPVLANAGKCEDCGAPVKGGGTACEACSGQKEGSIQARANQYIKKQGDEWVITQKGTGKVLSHHASEEEAEKSFSAMEMHKHSGARSRPNFTQPA